MGVKAKGKGRFLSLMQAKGFLRNFCGAKQGKSLGIFNKGDFQA